MSYKSYLSHHGIKGQRWGVENGPPYPLSPEVKAVAYRGGLLGDGRRINSITYKDVKKARKIVNKNIKALSADELQEYKERILLEKSMGEVLGTDTGDKLMKELKNNAVEAVGASVKKTGAEVLSNAEMATIGEILSSTLGPDVAAMVTNGKSRYDLSKEKEELRSKRAKEALDERQQKLNEEKHGLDVRKQNFEEKKYDDSGAENTKSFTRKNNADARRQELENEAQEIKNYNAKRDMDSVTGSGKDEGPKYTKEDYDTAKQVVSGLLGVKESSMPSYDQMIEDKSASGSRTNSSKNDTIDGVWREVTSNGYTKGPRPKSTKSSHNSFKPKYASRKKVNGKWVYEYDDSVKKNWDSYEEPKLLTSKSNYDVYSPYRRTKLTVPKISKRMKVVKSPVIRSKKIIRTPRLTGSSKSVPLLPG